MFQDTYTLYGFGITDIRFDHIYVYICKPYTLNKTINNELVLLITIDYTI